MLIEFRCRFFYNSSLSLLKCLSPTYLRVETNTSVRMRNHRMSSPTPDSISYRTEAVLGTRLFLSRPIRCSCGVRRSINSRYKRAKSFKQLLVYSWGAIRAFRRKTAPCQEEREPILSVWTPTAPQRDESSSNSCPAQDFWRQLSVYLLVLTQHVFLTTLLPPR